MKTKPRKDKKIQEKKTLKKTWKIFIQVEKWFLMLLKVKYFQQNLKDQEF